MKFWFNLVSSDYSVDLSGSNTGMYELRLSINFKEEGCFKASGGGSLGSKVIFGTGPVEAV